MVSLPTEPKILSIYLTHLSSFCKFSTLKRRLASIKVIHKIKGHYLIQTSNNYRKSFRYKRVHGVKQKSKKPLLINDLKLIINQINEEKNELKNSKIKV